MLDIIYLDNASTTPLDSRVLSKMQPYLTTVYGNANSVHSVGRLAVSALDKARETVAKIIGAEFNEIYFTSGGTEGANFALRGAFLNRKVNKNALVTSSIEHACVLQTANELEKQGAIIKKVKPNGYGLLSVSDYLSVGLDDAFIACMMMANNEIGTVMPVKEFCLACKEKGVVSFVDAVQAIGVTDINVKDLNVDCLSFSAHKFGGPKGVGVLYVKNGTKIAPLISGGHQERSKRAGTSNVAGAVGLATALSLTRQNLNERVNSIKALRDYFISRVLTEVNGVTVNGDLEKRLPGNVNFKFQGVNGEALLYQLDLNGVCASLGAACSSGTIEPSYVLTEIGLSGVDAKSSIRFSLEESNTKEEIDKTVEIIKKCLGKLIE